LAQCAMVRHRAQARAARYPARGTWTSTGPAARAARMVVKTPCGKRECAAGSRRAIGLASSLQRTTGHNSRRAAAGAWIEVNQPRSTIAWVSALRAYPTKSSAHDCMLDRRAATTRACG